jgi:hypothetical protein
MEDLEKYEKIGGSRVIRSRVKRVVATIFAMVIIVDSRGGFVGFIGFIGKNGFIWFLSQITGGRAGILGGVRNQSRRCGGGDGISCFRVNCRRVNGGNRRGDDMDVDIGGVGDQDLFEAIAIIDK